MTYDVIKQLRVHCPHPWVKITLMAIILFLLPSRLSFSNDAHTASFDNKGKLKHAISNSAQPKIKISGRVVDKDGFPMPGVTIVVKGKTGVGASTDAEGQYTIECASDDILVYSFISFKTVERVAEDMNRVTLTLEEDTIAIEEVVVVAFGKQKKESLVSSITTVRPSDLRIPSSNLTTAFAGRIAGVISFQRSGEPGLDDADFFIRGVTSFSADGKVDPLILIDGIEMDKTDLARINVNDIASFSVMKDASSSALYGARGANGVILVTTKEGQEGKVKVDVRAELSTSANTQLVKLADPITFMKLNNEAVRTRDPMTPIPFSSDKIYYTEQYYNEGKTDPYYPWVDWYDFLIKKRTFNQRVNTSLSGGGKAVTYFISANVSHETGILKESKENKFNNNIDLVKFQLRSNVTIKFSPQTKGIVRFYGTFDEKHGPRVGATQAFHLARNSSPVDFLPEYPKDYANEYTDHILFGAVPNYTAYTNPYAALLSGYSEEKKSMMLAQLEMEHLFDNALKGLFIRGMFNIKREPTYDFSRSYRPFYYTTEKTPDNSYKLYCFNPLGGTTWLDYIPGSRTIKSYIYSDIRVGYNKTIAEKHELGLILVSAILSNAVSTVDATGGTIQGSLPQRNITTSGRVTYGYDSRYFAEFNFGYNCSERFSKNNRFGFFPTIGGGWMISNESFMQNTNDWLNLLKISANYGLVGNDQIGRIEDRFFYSSVIDMDGPGYTFGTERGYYRDGIRVTRYANNLITWEISKKLNARFELGLFNVFDLILDVYTDTRRNILQTRTDVPATMGLVTIPQANIGVAKGSGFEVELKYQKSFNPNTFLLVNSNFTYAAAKFKMYEEPDYSDAPWRSRIGQKISQPFGYIAERLFIDDEDIRNSPTQQFGQYMAGDIKYKDVSGDGVINADDQVPIGLPTTPEINYGFGFTFSIHGFDINCHFSGSARSAFFLDPRRLTPFTTVPDTWDGTAKQTLWPGGQRGILQSIADDHWSENNRDLHAFWPRLSDREIDNNRQQSTWWLQDGTFIRLKQVEIGYTLPSKHSNKLRMDMIRIYATGSNIWIWSKFKMWDPEMAGNGLAYPVQRVFNVGLNVTF